MQVRNELSNCIEEKGSTGYQQASLERTSELQKIGERKGQVRNELPNCKIVTISYGFSWLLNQCIIIKI